jgi:hypothetical protein
MSEIKVKANRENAQKSTGPRTPEGKARVAQNAMRHGLRSRNAVLMMEENPKFQDLLHDFVAEWNPATLTEEDLVEQLAVNKWKLARYEAAESQACTQSTLVHLSLKGPLDYKRTPRGSLKPVDIVCKREARPNSASPASTRSSPASSALTSAPSPSSSASRTSASSASANSLNLPKPKRWPRSRRPWCELPASQP